MYISIIIVIIITTNYSKLLKLDLLFLLMYYYFHSAAVFHSVFFANWQTTIGRQKLADKNLLSVLMIIKIDQCFIYLVLLYIFLIILFIILIANSKKIANSKIY